MTVPERRPASPFFRPSEAVHVESKVLGTPHGRHKRNISFAVPDIKEHKSTILGCCVNLGTCIVGSGIVGLPYAMSNAGFVAGILLILLTGLLTAKSLRILVNTGKHLHLQNYETIARVPFGKAGYVFILCNMLVMAYGAMVTYLMITKTTFSLLFRVHDHYQQQYVLLVVSFFIQFPLACLRDMADLEKTSGLAVLIDLMIVLIVAYSAPFEKQLEETSLWYIVSNDSIHYDTIFVGLGVLSFAFECQEAAFLVAGSLSNPTSKRWSAVTSITLAFCVLLALLCGITGYLGFADAVKGNILDNFNPKLQTTVIVQGLLGTTMLATYPLASFVARHVIVALLFKAEANDTSILKRTDRRVLLTVVLYVCAMIPATIFTDMGRVLALAGVVGASCLAYIGPGMLFLAVHGGRFLELIHVFFYTSNDTQIGAVTETTPLTDSSSRQKLDGLVKTVLYHLLGMQLWCAIASVGKRRVIQHAEAFAAKNTIDQLRIGDVDLAGIEKIVHHPLQSRFIRTEQVAGTRKAPPKLEPDPQEDPPNCADFAIAVFYIVFGVVALFAGLISLHHNNSEHTSALVRSPH